MRQIARKPMIYKKKMREATRGQAPLTPVVPFRQSFLDEESFVCLGKLLFYGYSKRR